MKKSKLIIPAMGILLLSSAASVTGTVAWFTANKSVTASGMKVKAKAEGSLVISNAVPTAATTSPSYTFTDSEVTELYASTHDWTVGTTAGLKYITNSEVISPDTGLAYTEEDDDDIDWANAVNSVSPKKNFYKDYSVYISSSGEEIKGQKIKVELTNGQDLTINGAISIDFYASASSVATVVTPSSTTFAGTLNLAQYDAETNNKTAKSYLYIAETSGVDIAVNKDGKGISVLMRVYYDGALLSDDLADDYILMEANKGTTTGKVDDPETVDDESDPTDPGTYYDNRCGAITATATTDVTSLYTKLSTTCDKTFARNVNAANITEQTLGVRFTAEDK